MLTASNAPAALADGKSSGSGSAERCYWGACMNAESHQSVPGTPEKAAPAKKPAKKESDGGYLSTCQVVRLPQQPPAGSSLWEGHSAKDGAVYMRTCAHNRAGAAMCQASGVTSPECGKGEMFFSRKPPEGGEAVNPVELAQKAVSRMKLTGPKVISPKPEGKYVVGMPMWLQVGKTETGFGPRSASASAGGVSVTAKAKVSELQWQMGDGQSVTCTSAGTPYDPSRGKAESPDCGHTYRSSSKDEADRAFHGSVAATWTVEWEGAGQSGDFTISRDSDFSVEVGESKALH